MSLREIARRPDLPALWSFVTDRSYWCLPIRAGVSGRPVLDSRGGKQTVARHGRRPAVSALDPAAADRPAAIAARGRIRASSTKSASCSRNPNRLLPPLKSPGEAIEATLNASARGAGESLSNIALQPSMMVSGRDRLSGGGQWRAGLQGGRRAGLPEQRLQGRQEPDTDAADTCSPKVSCRPQAQPGDRKTENYVTRALCQ